MRKMRRIAQQISQKECEEIMLHAKTGILGVFGDDGYPYTVPLNFVYAPAEGTPGTINFHCATAGHKIDAIKRNEKVSFTVVDRDIILPRERATEYISVIAFGRARILEGDENLRRAANMLGAKYSSGYEDLYKAETEETIRRGTLCCVEITIDHMTGKISRGLMTERKRASKNKESQEEQ